jgi:hypothetical protein
MEAQWKICKIWWRAKCPLHFRPALRQLACCMKPVLSKAEGPVTNILRYPGVIAY